MKTILIIISLIFLSISCKSQSIIIPLDESESEYGYSNNPNYYIKDIDNEFDKFEGTWFYNNGNTEITIKLKKETQYQVTDNDSYEDLLVGEYKYVRNNLIVINSLDGFNNPFIEGYGHSISGGYYINRLPNYCIDNSQLSEIKISLIINDPSNRDIQGRLILRHLNDNGIEKLQACFYDESTLALNPNDRIAIPDGYYEFIKQD